MLTEEADLEKTLRSELSTALIQQRALQIATGFVGAGGFLRLTSARSTNSNQTISHIWTSIYLFSTTGILLYVQALPSKSLGLKQRSLHNYLSYNEAVLIDIRRRDRISKQNLESDTQSVENTEEKQDLETTASPESNTEEQNTEHKSSDESSSEELPAPEKSSNAQEDDNTEPLETENASESPEESP